MVNSRQKGDRGEKLCIEFLKDYVELEQTPGSGSGKIKGDLHCKGINFCIEVKNYKEDPLGSTILCNKTSLIPQWWEKLKSCSKKEPLLFYRWNRSKWFVVTASKPVKTKNYLDFPVQGCYVLLAEEWLQTEEIKWTTKKL